MLPGRRLARSLPLAASLVLLTLIGHTSGSGSLPSLTASAVVALPASAIAVAVAGRRRSMPSLIATLLAGELLLHLLLVTSAGHAHHGSMFPSGLMLIGHVAAAVSAALVFAYGETLTARWLAYLAQAIGAPLLPTLAHPPTSTPVITFTGIWIDVRLTQALTRRGPPASMAI